MALTTIHRLPPMKNQNARSDPGPSPPASYWKVVTWASASWTVAGRLRVIGERRVVTVAIDLTGHVADGGVSGGDGVAQRVRDGGWPVIVARQVAAEIVP